MLKLLFRVFPENNPSSWEGIVWIKVHNTTDEETFHFSQAQVVQPAWETLRSPQEQRGKQFEDGTPGFRAEVETIWNDWNCMIDTEASRCESNERNRYRMHPAFLVKSNAQQIDCFGWWQNLIEWLWINVMALQKKWPRPLRFLARIVSTFIFVCRCLKNILSQHSTRHLLVSWLTPPRKDPPSLVHTRTTTEW